MRAGSVRGAAVLASTAAVGAGACAVGLLAVSGWLIARAAEQPPVLYLMVAIVAVRALALGRAVLRYVERLAAHDAAFRALTELRVQVYRKLERLAPAGLDIFRSGDLVSRFVEDVDSLLDRLVRVRIPATSALIVGAGAAVGLGFLLPTAGAIVGAGCAVAYVVVPLIVRAATRRAQRSRADLRGELAASYDDLLLAAPDLIAFGATERALSAVAELDRQVRRAERRGAWGNGLGSAVVLVVSAAMVLGTLAVGMSAVRSGELASVLLPVIVLVPLALTEILAVLPLAAGEQARIAAAHERVTAVLAAADPVLEPPIARPIPHGPPHVEVRNLFIERGPAARFVLRGVDLDLPPGRRTAVVGASGAGKSTLAQAMLKELDPGAGTISINGVTLRNLSGDDVRATIGLCEQDTYIFDSNIVENVRLAQPGADDSAVIEAIRRAGLGRWLASLPLGLETPVGEHGARLSGGERQRIGLARVLLADFPVIILDEPTEHLDDPTAQAIMTDLLDATTGRTVLLLTHDRRLLDRVDEVFELSSGTLRPLTAGSDPTDPSGAHRHRLARVS